MRPVIIRKCLIEAEPVLPRAEHHHELHIYFSGFDLLWHAIIVYENSAGTLTHGSSISL